MTLTLGVTGYTMNWVRGSIQRTTGEIAYNSVNPSNLARISFNQNAQQTPAGCFFDNFQVTMASAVIADTSNVLSDVSHNPGLSTPARLPRMGLLSRVAVRFRPKQGARQPPHDRRFVVGMSGSALLSP